MSKSEPSNHSSTANNVCPTCGKECKNERGRSQHHKIVHGESLSTVTLTCAGCGTDIERPQWRVNQMDSDRAFCDPQCRNEHCGKERRGENHPLWYEGSRVDVVCDECGSDIPNRERWQVEAGEHNFCDSDCRDEWRLNPENNAYIRRGSSNPLWRGGKNYRDAIRRCIGPWTAISKRIRKSADVCLQCGEEPDGPFHAHHIVPVSCGGVHHDDNILALCASCHRTADLYTRELFDPVLIE